MENRSPWKRRPNIETDSYVIVPAVTPFSDILNTALQRLGYSSDIASTARGSIIIKNWKPLPMEKIADSPLVSVGEILGELTSVVTLRIVILRTKPSTFTEIKDKLLKLLILQSHAVLRSAGCPLDEVCVKTFWFFGLHYKTGIYLLRCFWGVGKRNKERKLLEPFIAFLFTN